MSAFLRTAHVRRIPFGNYAYAMLFDTVAPTD